MEQIKLLFYGIWVVILILSLFNLECSHLKHDFDRYCVKQYDINGPCPCVKPATQGFMIGSDINISSNQEPLYIGS